MCQQAHGPKRRQAHDPSHQAHDPREVPKEAPDLYDCYFSDCQVVVTKRESLQKHIYWQHLPKASRPTRFTKLRFGEDVKARALTAEHYIDILGFVRCGIGGCIAIRESLAKLKKHSKAMHGIDIESRESSPTHELLWHCSLHPPESINADTDVVKKELRSVKRHIEKKHPQDLTAYMEEYAEGVERSLDDMIFQVLRLKENEEEQER